MEMSGPLPALAALSPVPIGRKILFCGGGLHSREPKLPYLFCIFYSYKLKIYCLVCRLEYTNKLHYYNLQLSLVPPTNTGILQFNK